MNRAVNKKVVFLQSITLRIIIRYKNGSKHNIIFYIP